MTLATDGIDQWNGCGGGSGSGDQALAIQCRDGRLVVAGYSESMSRACRNSALLAFVLEKYGNEEVSVQFQTCQSFIVFTPLAMLGTLISAVSAQTPIAPWKLNEVEGTNRIDG